MERIDFRKIFREAYGASAQPVLVEVPPLRFLCLDGTGDPVSSPDSRATLKALGDRVRAQLRRGPMALDIAPMPFELLRFDEHRWQLLLMQAQVVDGARVEAARAALRDSRHADLLDAVRLEFIEEGRAVQLLIAGAEHIPAATLLTDFASGHGLQLAGPRHEIDLTDRRHGPRTLIRYPVRGLG